MHLFQDLVQGATYKPGNVVPDRLKVPMASPGPIKKKRTKKRMANLARKRKNNEEKQLPDQPRGVLADRLAQLMHINYSKKG